MKNSAICLLSLVSFCVSAIAGVTDPELLVGKHVDVVKSAWGRPTFIHTQRNGTTELKYVRIRVLNQDGTVRLELNRLPEEGEIGENEQVRRCITDFTVHSTGLVLSWGQMGGECTDYGQGQVGPEAADRRGLTSMPAWRRYDGPDGVNLVSARAPAAIES